MAWPEQRVYVEKGPPGSHIALEALAAVVAVAAVAAAAATVEVEVVEVVEDAVAGDSVPARRH